MLMVALFFIKNGRLIGVVPVYGGVVSSITTNNVLFCSILFVDPRTTPEYEISDDGPD